MSPNNNYSKHESFPQLANIKNVIQYDTVDFFRDFLFSRNFSLLLFYYRTTID